MTLQPLLDSSTAIQIHVAAAVLAFLLGAVVLFRRKGDRLHRIGGRVWVGAMVIVCVSSMFIHTIRLFGPWSPIHLLSIGTMLALGAGIWRVWRRDIEGHRRTMQWTYAGALLIAGAFTFLPGRIMHEVLFGGPRPWEGALLAATVIAAGAWLTITRRQQRAR